MSSISVRLSPEILHQLRTTGLMSAAAADLLGVGPRQAARLLAKAGATRCTTGGMWKMGPRFIRSARPLHRNQLPVEMRIELMRKLGIRYWKHVAPQVTA